MPAPVPESGFTLIELIATIAILAIAIAGISSALTFALMHQADSLPRGKLAALAQAYADEIIAKRYDEHTPSGGLPACSPATLSCSAAGAFDDGETRASYDDVDDYHGIDDSPPRFLDNQPMLNYDGYRVRVTVRYPDATEASNLGLSSTQDAKIVRILVNAPGNDSQTFSLIRANF